MSFCPSCFDAGEKVDMDHLDDEVVRYDPANEDGVTYRTLHYLFCPICGYNEECLEHHSFKHNL